MPLSIVRKAPARNKKATGKHHKTNKKYLKTYWPYLPMIGLIIAGLVINGLLNNSGTVLGDTSDYSSTSLLTSTNTDRLKNNEKPLVLNAQLEKAAQAKAEDMVSRDYWSHYTPDGRSPWEFIEQAGYSYKTAGENLAYGFTGSSEVLSAWMNSPQHRANVLNQSYVDVGFGVASSPDFNKSGPATVVVALYGSPSSSTLGMPSTSGISSPPMEPVNRIQLVAGAHASFTSYLVILVAGVAILILAIRHIKAWHRLIVRGEDFILDHIWIDMVIVSIATSSYIMIQSVGLIG